MDKACMRFLHEVPEYVSCTLYDLDAESLRMNYIDTMLLQPMLLQ